jgi:hypothetical protein
MSIYVPPRSVEPMKAGPIGPGAGVLMTEYLMPMMLATDPQRKIRMALKLGQEVSWIRAAERVISGKIGGDPDLQGAVQWRLEDPDGEIIDEDYDGDKRAIDAYFLVSQPIHFIDAEVPDSDKQVTVAEYQGQLWEVTSRHMGLAGQGYWFLDSLNAFGVPQAILYVRPDRLFPDMDDAGNLTGWFLDPKNGNPKTGMHLDLKEIIQFPLETPTDGFISAGLVESAILKMQLNTAIDRHLGSMIATGGRLSGMFAPKGAAIEDDGTWDQLVRDMRNLSEQPDAAKRVQLMRAPMEYTRTQATIQEMAVIDLMTKNRDDLLALWGVPLSQVGGATPSGLNSGDVRKYDEAALWQNAVVTRLVPIKQRIQRRLLHLYKPILGWEPKLVLEIPEFDDDSPKYDKVQKAQFIALRNKERRGMLGFEPFGPDVLGTTGQPLDDEIWMPIAMMPSAMAAAPDSGQSFNNMVIVAAGAGGAGATGQPATGAQSGATPASGIPDKGPEKPSLSAVSAGSAQVPAGGAGATLKAKVVDGPDVVRAVMAALKKQWPAKELEIVKQGKWKFYPAFPMKKINAARRPIARNPKIVADVEAVLAIGAPIAPITIIHTKRIGKPGYEPIDGWHREGGADHQGLKTIPAYVGEGSDEWTKAMIAFDDDIPTPPDSAADEEPADDTEGKAQTSFRRSLEVRVTPQLQRSVTQVLDDQRRSIAVRVRSMYDAIKANPRDTTIWWPKGSWDARLADALKPTLADVAESVRTHVTTTFKPVSTTKASVLPKAVEHVLTRGAARVTGINETTRAGIAALVEKGIDDSLTPVELGDAVAAWSGFDEYRAEMIARTELMDAYNAAALGSYGELGVEMVEAIDGDGDQECIDRVARNPYTLSDADAEEDHPNGTLDWVPAATQGA